MNALELYAHAVAAHRAGRRFDAEAMLRTVLETDPAHADALHMLGVIAQQNRRPIEAESLFRQALALREDPIYLANFGNFLHEAGRLAEASAVYQRALELRADLAPVSFHLGLALHQMGRLHEAEVAFDHTLNIDPRHVPALYNLAILLKQCDRLAEAESAYRKLIAMQPDFVDAYNNLGNLLQQAGRLVEAEAQYHKAIGLRPEFAEAHYNLGRLCQLGGRKEQAESCYRRALLINPQHVTAHYNLATLLHDAKRLPEAEASYRCVLALQPAHVNSLNNYGNLLQETDRPLEAEAIYRRASEADPACVEARHNLVLSLMDRGLREEALCICQSALQLAPANPDLHLSYAMMLLLRGEFAAGWREYEWRWQSTGNDVARAITQPLWLGNADLQGKAILLYAEQGFGDTLQFLRYATELAARGARVYLEVPTALVRLAASCAGITAVFALGETLPPFDYQCPLLSLPLACNTGLDTIPAAIPYLRAAPANVEAWRARIGAGEFMRIGLAWAGNPRKQRPWANEIDRQRSVPFGQFHRLLDVAGVQFYSLQLGEDAVRQLNCDPRVIDFTDQLHDFEETAALIQNLDLVICVDTSIAHLAGALGKPVWMLNRFNTCWRWLLDREDSPWYPSMKIFRQPKPGDWDQVMVQVKAALEQR